MKKTTYYPIAIFLKMVKKFKRIKISLSSSIDMSLYRRRVLERKGSILKRRIENYNRRFALGLTSIVLSTFLSLQGHAQIQNGLKLDSLDGINGIKFPGLNNGDETGTDLDNVGDFNKDGFDDIIITTNVNKAYFVFGSATLNTAVFDLSSLNGTNGFLITANTNLQGSVSGLGDVNKDGIDDFILGGKGNKAYVVYGSTTFNQPTLNLSTLDGTNGIIIHGDGSVSGFGYAVSGVGDVNGDSINDILISAPFPGSTTGTNLPTTYLIHGGNNLSDSINVSQLDGTNGMRFFGDYRLGYAGIDISGAGDFNNDGYADILIGAYEQLSSSSQFDGAAHLIYGVPSYASDSLNLADLNGNNGFSIIENNHQGNRLGYHLSGLGDFNGDSIDDIIIGGLYGRNRFVLYGNSTFNQSYFDLGTDLNGTNGFLLKEDQDLSILYVSGAGDFNGDGFNDIVTGQYYGDLGSNEMGGAHVIFGTDTMPDQFDLSAVDGNNGFVMTSISHYSYDDNAVASAGDFNGDGVDDILIGDVGSQYTSEPGAAFLVFGQADTTTTTDPVDPIDTTAIEKVNENNILIYPNPASSLVRIENIGNRKIYGIKLKNNLGQLVKTVDAKLNTSSYNLNVSSLLSGIYILEVEFQNRTSNYQIIVK